jgi:deoxyribodipyrimidine photo-lyase
VATKEGKPFVVYTAFRRACEALPLSEPLPRVRRLAAHDLPRSTLASLGELGFSTTQTPWPGGTKAAKQRLRRFLSRGLARYEDGRDHPADPATARLSADLKFGTLSPRTVTSAVIAAAREDGRLRPAAEKFVSELRWRDFYAHVLWHFPHVEHGAFRPEYDALAWGGTQAWFQAWCAGRTGYPIVDAGMRELAVTGFMHNRVRMIVASFLTKDLLLDWRRGERWFMNHLVDGDLASNNGGWQWAAGTGTDAAPYFRIFNPVSQGMRFDPDGAYVRQWVPELSRLADESVHRPWETPPLILAEAGLTLGEDYPERVVDHAEQRERALAMYAEVKSAAATSGSRASTGSRHK